jgi:hypothetical protein
MNNDVRVVDSHPHLFELLFSIYLKQIQSNSNQFFLSIFNLSTRKPPSSSSPSTHHHHSDGDDYYDREVEWKFVSKSTSTEGEMAEPPTFLIH